MDCERVSRTCEEQAALGILKQQPYIALKGSAATPKTK
jgi:hypothetical protein